MELFKEFSKMRFTKYIKKKGTLNYLSWTVAWDSFSKKLIELGVPEEDFSVEPLIFKNKDGVDVPYIYDENTGYMVFTQAKVEGAIKKMWLPVMDSNNKAMKDKPYTYNVKVYKFGKFTGEYEEKTVEAATMTDINRAIMRCMVKNLALFGLGLSIYNGEDLPEDTYDNKPEKITKEMEDSLREMVKTKNIPDAKVIEVLKANGFKKMADITTDKVVNVRNELARC